MILEAFVLPLPGRSLGVVFWDRVRRTPGESALAVYAPGELSAGELSEVAASLVASLGAAASEQTTYGPRPLILIAWWVAGLVTAFLLALHAFSLGPAFAWIAAIAVGATLPWGMTAGASAAARRAAAARRVARLLGELEPVAGADPRAGERLSAIWQFARAQRGSETEQLRALERFCDEQAWPAAAAVYRDRVDAPVAGRRWLVARPLERRSRLFSQCEMRAWPST
jgi:hypothetical protein